MVALNTQTPRLPFLPVCGLVACLWGCPGPTPPPPPAKIPTTYRIISGVSMGGLGASALGFSRPERFDAVASQGGPFDAALLLRTIDRFHLAGFCTLAELEAIAARDPSLLNDPKEISLCARRTPNIANERSQDFNHWVYTTNGGDFERDKYSDLFSDLTLAYGNVLYENPESAFAPPGVPVEWARHPPADACQTPVRLQGFKNAEYNPQGTYDVITFCDQQQRLFFCRGNMEPVDFCSDPANVRTPLPMAQEETFAAAYCATQGGFAQATKDSQPLYMLNHAGVFDPCRESTLPLVVALAVDINGNGRRDYGEPVVNNGWERFDDVGADGCADGFEDGSGGCLPTANGGGADPNGDNYDADSNPHGTESNWTWEEGEPYRDFGLDGVPGTSDVGEGNGQYDMSSGRRAMFAMDSRTHLRKMSPEARARIDVLADGGIRDLFNFGLMARQVFGLLRSYRTTPTGSYRDFIEIPGMTDRRTGNFSPWNQRWKTVPRDLLMVYGKENPTDEDRVEGEGDHVGTALQAASRFYTLFNWAAATYPNLERPSTPLGGASASERQKVIWYDSALLGAKREYGISLPPGYDLPENQDKRYPVLYLLHGYGMDPRSFMATSLITDTYVTDPDVKLRPMILVFPSGRCCFVHLASGARDCRETDDDGVDLSDLPGWERECHKGNFYVNRQGFFRGDERAYGDAFFELMEYIDQNYRTVPAAEVEAR